MRAVGLRMAFVVLGAAVVSAFVAWYLVALMRSPATVAVQSADGSRVVELRLQSVGALGPRYSNSTWVSYLVRDAESVWRHSTNISVPANATVRVTVEQYDSQTGLRNPFFAQPQGVSAFRVDDTPQRVVDPDSVAHTFAIPQLGVYAPLPGISDSAANPCAEAPCSAEQAHRTVTFTFRTGKPGRYRWQCFVPCAAGFINGNGGPMQRFGYMDGYLNVV